MIKKLLCLLSFIFLISSCAESIIKNNRKILGKKSLSSGETVEYKLLSGNIPDDLVVNLKDDSGFIIETYYPLINNDKIIIKRFLNKKIPFYKNYKLSFEAKNSLVSSIPINIESSIIITSLCNKQSCDSLSGNILGGLKFYLKVDSYKFSPIKIVYNITSPYSSQEFDHLFNSPVSNDILIHKVQDVPENISSYITLFKVSAYDAENNYVENIIPIKVVKPLEVKHYGKYELAEVYDSMPVTGCIPGSVGNSVQYSESQSETKQNSVSIVINKSWSDSFSNNTSQTFSEGISVNETQGTVNSSSLSSSETQSESYQNTISEGESNNISFSTNDGESWSWSLGESNSETQGQSSSQGSNTNINGSVTTGVSGEGSLPFLAKASGKVEVSAGISRGWNSSDTLSQSESSSSSRGYSTSGSSQNGKTFGSVQNDTRSHSLSGAYVLSKNVSNTISESSSLSSGRVWNMSESTTSGKVVTEGNSESLSQTIVSSETSSTIFSYSGYIPRGRFGMFHRQTSRYVKLSEIISYDLNGFPIHSGFIVMNNWSWAPDLKIGNSCEEVLNSNLPQSECLIPPCGE